MSATAKPVSSQANSIVSGFSDNVTNRLFDASFLIAILVVSGFAFSLSVAEPDLWGHVQYGRDALREGLHHTTTYSFTANGYRWINHENLSELLFATVYDQVGLWALLAGKCVLGLLITGLMLWRAHRQGVPSLVAAATVLLVSVNLTGFWYVRPQILSYTMFAIMIAMLSFSFHGWEDQWHAPFASWLKRSHSSNDRFAGDRNSLDEKRLLCVGAASVLFIVWVNTHGAFLAGLCIFLAYTVIRAIEIALNHGARGRSIAGRLVGIAGLVATATLINPYGYELHAWLLESLTIPRPEIIEWHPLHWNDQPFIPFAMLCTMVLCGLLLSRRSLDATHLAILVLAFWQAASHQRHIPFFVILCGFWMPIHWHSAWQRWESKRESAADMGRHAKLTAAVGLMLTSSAIALLLAARCQQLPVQRGQYPITAMEFMARNNLNGKLVVTYNWAQYAIAALGVAEESSRVDSRKLTTVSFDGRFRTCYPLSTIDKHFDFVLGNHPSIQRYRSPDSPPPDPAAILELNSPDFVLVSRKQPHSVNVLEANRHDWTLLYQDELAQVWGRQDRYGEPQSLDYFSPSRRIISDRPQTGSVPWPALPQQDKS